MSIDQAATRWRRAVRGAIGLAVLLLPGCGGDPVRADLELYERTVLVPLAREERITAEELAPLVESLAAGKLEPKTAHKHFRSTLVERYRGVVEALEAHKPATRELADLHARLTGQYRVVVREVEEVADALSHGDWRKADEVHTRLAKLGFESVRAELSALAAQHGLDVHVEPPGR